MAKIKNPFRLIIPRLTPKKGGKATVKGYVSERKGINLCRSVFVVQLISEEAG